MRSSILLLAVGAVSLLGPLAIGPSQAHAQLYRPWWWTCATYGAYSYRGHTFSNGYGFPYSSYYWGYYGDHPGKQ
jgi:hypothetical protein